ncbi:MAG: hypothetical protein ISS31_07035 [Kiritimatiellae bacterium]|nr:hypothetical protein [Kiritimatiellia bacterium]
MRRAVLIALACWSLCRMAPGQPPGPESIILPTPDTYPHGITSDGTNLWLTNYSTDTLYRLDPTDGTVLGTFPLDVNPSSPRGLAWDGQYLWVATSSWIRQIDPETGLEISFWGGFDTNQQGVAFDGTNLWVASLNTGNISCIDPVSGTVLSQIPSPATSPRGIEYRNGRLWHADSYQDRIYEIDPATGDVLGSFLMPRSGARGLAWHGDRFWMVDKDAAQIIGFPTARSGPHTITAGYVSQGTTMCVFTNTSGSAYTNTHVYMALAQSDTGSQILSRRFFVNGIEHVPLSLDPDEFGQVTADMFIGTVAPGAVITTSVEHIARLWNWTVDVHLEQVGSRDTIDPAITNLYARDEVMYGIHTPYIQAEAEVAVGTESNIFTMAHRIHDHVIESTTYDVDAGWSDAVTVLQQGYASCSGYAYSMIALCRARGIPARFAGGSECRSFEAGSLDTLHHRWVEVFIPGYGWVPFDPTHDDWSDEGQGLRWREVGGQQRAIILRRGGGPNVMGWQYVGRAEHDGGGIDEARSSSWIGMPWTDDGDLDGDGVSNIDDAFAYDRAASADTDGDGMPDDWNSGYTAGHSTSVPPLLADDNDDNDALTDEEEAIAGTDPADANSTLAIRGMEVAGNNLELYWPSASGRVYAVWASTNIGDSSVCEHADIPANPPLNTYTTAIPVVQQFYRVHVALAP